jgi:hypothetical protein
VWPIHLFFFFGFRHNRSCIDQINTLRVIIEQSVEFQSPLYMLFVDYQRAFDSLNSAWIWDELKARGLPSRFINLHHIMPHNSRWTDKLTQELTMTKP